MWESSAPVAEPLAFNTERNGWHIDRTRFDTLLADAAQQSGAVFRRGAVALSCQQRSDGRWRVQFDSDGRRSDIDARWMIDATGRRSWLVRRQGVTPRVCDRLVGLLGYCGSRASDHSDLFVEATPNGWWYSAPLPGGRSVAAFMTDSDLIPRDGRGMASFWEDQRARSELISRLHNTMFSFRTVVARTAFSGRTAAVGWLAVGDAAMAFDPLLGLGVCQALASGWSSARVLLDGWADATAVITRYESWSASRYRDYLAQRSHAYSMVTRWPHSPFWRRRASSTDAP
jgi:flavin-dependent dehydrogenase